MSGFVRIKFQFIFAGSAKIKNGGYSLVFAARFERWALRWIDRCGMNKPCF